MTERDLGSRAARGAVVTVGAQAIRIVLQIASVPILARLLGDYAYGLFGMLVPVIGLGELLRDFGLSQAAIQAPSVSARQRSNLFWINTGIGAALTLACVAAAPLAGMYFTNDQVVPLLRVASLMFLFNGLTAQYRAVMARSMRFKALAVIDVLAPALALGCALALAWAGAGAWALVGQQLAVGVVTLGLAVAATRWVPGLPRRGVPMRAFLRFGFGLFASQLLGYLAKNVDSLIIGRRFSTESLGQYTRAFSMLMTPLNQIRGPSTTVAVPTLSRMNDDPARFNRFVRGGQTTLGLPTTVLLVLVSGAAYPLVGVMLGTGWGPAASVLQFLALAGMFQILDYVGYWVYLARAKTKALAQYTAVSCVIRIICIAVGSHWGIVGVAAGYAVVPMLSWPISLMWLGRATSMPTRELLVNGLRIVALSIPVWLTTRGVVAWAGAWPVAAQLVVSVVAGLAVAVLILGVVPVYRREVAEMRRVVSLVISSRRSTTSSAGTPAASASEESSAEAASAATSSVEAFSAAEAEDVEEPDPPQPSGIIEA